MQLEEESDVEIEFGSVDGYEVKGYPEAVW